MLLRCCDFDSEATNLLHSITAVHHTMVKQQRHPPLWLHLRHA
jgi:hypothetical protein